MYGYDGTYFTGMLEMQRFKEDFGEYDAATGTYEIKSTYTAVFASIVQAGEFVGSLMASRPSRRPIRNVWNIRLSSTYEVR